MVSDEQLQLNLLRQVRMSFSAVEGSLTPWIQVSAFNVIGAQYRGLEIRARNGRRCTKPCLVWATVALCSAAAATVSTVSIASCVYRIIVLSIIAFIGVYGYNCLFTVARNACGLGISRASHSDQ